MLFKYSYTSLIIFVAGFYGLFIQAQTTNQSEDIKWSRIKSDINNFTTNLSDYKYVPISFEQSYSFDATEVSVLANYRVLPTTNTTQSELSIDIHPANPNIIFAGSNGTPWPVTGVYGTGSYWTLNAGSTWSGFDNPSPYFGSSNSGDPAAVIGLNGNFYMGYIRSGGGQGVSVSTNNGATWSTYQAAANPAGINDLLDKNHLWADKKAGSPYVNRVYDAWTHFVSGNASNNQVVINFSTNSGVNWSSFVDISASLTPGSHAQGVNINTGPNGEVYAVFAIYDNWGTGVYGEDAIGFAKSTDGGVSWTKTRIYSAANFGIRGNLKSTSIRVSSFPSMTVDRSGGPRNGYIYICWPQRGVSPAGTDPDIVMIRSTNGGNTWSSPVRVNDDPLNNGKDQYYSWCTVDQATGQLHIVFYDNRHTTADSSGVWMATSNDGGFNFINYKVSDANFKPKPIQGLASGYQGDYIGITASNGRAYPFWADDRTGNYQAWITTVSFAPVVSHSSLPDTENLNGPYIINATINSENPLVPSLIKVYWGRGAGLFTDSLVMTNTGGSNYTASIPGNGLPNTYSYYLKAVDNAGFSGFSPAGAPGTYHSFVVALDNQSPTITHTPLTNMTASRFPPDVLADVTDNLGVQSVVCEFRKNAGSISTFTLNYLSGNTYSGTFPAIPVSSGDLIEYRIKATDISMQNNTAYNPGSGFHSFNIVESLGFVLVIDDDVTLGERASLEKASAGNLSTPLGASANLFTTSLINAGYTVDQVIFASLNTAVLSNYDLVVLSAGVKESSIFNDVAKRTALVNYTLAGGKTIVEGGEVGYIFRKAGTSTDLHPAFRRNLLLDSLWVSDRSGASLQIVNSTHPIFNIPNIILSPITINNSGSPGYGARDEMTVLPGVTGISRIANWSGGTAANAGIFIYNPGGDTSVCRNIFYSFSVSQFANQSTAANLIVNSVRYLMRDLAPSNKTLTVSVIIEGFWNGSSMISDDITVELRNSSAPYTIVQQQNISLNIAGTGSGLFNSASDGTPYYIVIKHRNSIETWSAAPQSFTAGLLSYDFTNASNKAFGNNMKLKNGKWCIFSGDVNQDGLINSNDVSSVFNDNINGASGYIVTDLSGDSFTEIDDLNIVFINNAAGVSRQRPPGAVSSSDN